MLEDLVFENPAWFWLLLILPVLIFWRHFNKDKQHASVKMPTAKAFSGHSDIWSKIRPILFYLKILALALFITAMTRPRTVDVSTQTKKTRGIDIVMAIDVSASMLARDLEPNRLEALKNVASNFIKKRVNDRIGLVVYSGESYTKTPVTSDKSIALSAIEDLKYSQNIKGGTAIGMGLATAVNRLKDSKAESKVIILLTDGVNNSGFIDPKTATELAISEEIKTYSIGIGTKGKASSPVSISKNGQINYRPVEVKIDDELLQYIADQTGGKYYRATDREKLNEIYESINKLEKTVIEEKKFYDYQEKFRPLLIIGGILLLIEVLLKFTLFRSFV